MAKRKSDSSTGRNQARQAVRKTRTLKAAAQIVQGGTVTQAAKTVGITPRQLYTDLRQPEIQTALAQIYNENAERFRKLFSRSLDVIADSLEANLVAYGATPAETELPDHAVRLKAVAELRHLIDVGQRFAAPSGQPPEGALPQWEDFQAVVLAYRRSPARPS